MLAVATGKLKLEHLVIEKGHFKQEKESAKVDLQVSVTALQKNPCKAFHAKFVWIRCF